MVVLFDEVGTVIGYRMQSLQQTIFHNLASKTPYSYSSKQISQKHLNFPKYRQQELINQFQLIDINHTGKLSQKTIINYLSDKYQWLNTNVIKALFNTMVWEKIGDQDFVHKGQFVNKYLQREKLLYHEINGLKYYHNWVVTLEEIYYNQLSTKKPRVYFYTQIRSIELFLDSEPIEWMDLIVEYENHDTKTFYEIEEASHSSSFPSFEIWLPAHGQSFFVKFKFLDENDHKNIYGQTYLSMPLRTEMSKITNMQLDIMRNGSKVGSCVVALYAEPSLEKVKRELNEIKNKQRMYRDLSEDKIKEYDYLHFLFGIRHRSPHKVSPLEVKWMLAVRLLLLVVLGTLGTIVHIYGRCEPLSIIIMFLMLRVWEFVMLRHEKFVIIWLIVCSILLDIIWIALCSSEPSYISYTPQINAVIWTYALMGTKAVLFGYMLLVERSLSSGD